MAPVGRMAPSGDPLCCSAVGASWGARPVLDICTPQPQHKPGSNVLTSKAPCAAGLVMPLILEPASEDEPHCRRGKGAALLRHLRMSLQYVVGKLSCGKASSKR